MRFSNRTDEITNRNQFVVFVILAAIVIFVSQRFDRRSTVGLRTEANEQTLIDRIHEMPNSEKRVQLIDELDKTPVPPHGREFYNRWLHVHNFYCDAWTDKGYFPDRSQFPPDIQIMGAAFFSKLDIDNGGFHQFFSNDTGRLAPEFAEWLERSGMAEASKVVHEAMETFGSPFPRSREKRNEFLSNFAVGKGRSERNPFVKLDSRFSETTRDADFDKAANMWIRDVCGIGRLRDGFFPDIIMRR